jgi:hypothetical protein
MDIISKLFIQQTKNILITNTTNDETANPF